MSYEPGKNKKLDALLETLETGTELSPYIKACIYGPFGTGKTVLSATAGKKICYIDSGENGWVSLKNHPDLMANIAVRVPFKTLEQLDTLAESFLDGTFPYEIDCFVIDTISDIQKKDLDQVMAARCKKDPSKDPDAPTQPDYNMNTNRLRRTLSKYRDLPVNLVVVGQERNDKDQTTGVANIRFDVSDKVGKFICQMAHLVGYLDADDTTDNPKRFLQVHPTKKLMAKCRIGGLTSKVENPNLADIFALWEGE